jgi:hypothetical protein
MALKGTDTVIRLDHAYFALSGDVVGKLCWAEKDDFLDDPNFGVEWCGHVFAHVHVLPTLMQRLGTLWFTAS